MPTSNRQKAKGWCLFHKKLVYPDKFTSKCRTGSGGKRCKHFTYTIPSYIKKRRKK